MAIITSNRSERSNAIGKAVREGLYEPWDRFEKNEAAKVAILTGTGDKAFCAGMDLKGASATGIKIPPKGFIPVLCDNIHASKPTISAVSVCVRSVTVV